MQIRNIALGLLFIAVFLAGGSLLVAHAQSVTLNAGETYNTTFVDVDLSANTTVTYKVSYVDENNQTQTYLTLSGVAFSYNTSQPLILTVENSGSSPANITFNKLDAELASSGSYQVTPSDKVVKIPVTAKAGDTLKITVTPNGDPYVRYIAVALGYTDGSYEEVVKGSTARSVSDSDWPSSLTPYCDYVWGSSTYTVTASKDVSSVIVYISVGVGHWDVSVSTSSGSGSDTGTGTSTASPAPENTNTEAGASDTLLGNDINIFGHQTSVASIVVILLVLLLLGAVLLRR